MYRPPALELRERVLNEVVADFSADPDVLGIFLAGSLAAGTADPHSDIDLRVVVSPTAHSAFIAARLSRPSGWTGFLFNEWGEDPTCCVSHFQHFVKLDIFYLKIEDLSSSQWLRQPIRVIHDPNGLLRTSIQSMEGVSPAPNPEHVERAIGKALSYAHETARRIACGELIYAESLLNSLRQQIVALEDFEQQRTPGRNSSFKVDLRISTQLRNTLLQSFARADAAEMGRALFSLVTICRPIVIRLHEQFRLARPIANDLAALDALSQIGP